MLSLRNIYKTFNTGTSNEMSLYQNLSISVKKGDFITIIGSNGSGKSSLLNMIAGSLNADEGSIEFLGKDISLTKEHQRSTTISRVYQDPLKGTAPSLTILENLSMAANKGKPFNLKKGVNPKQIDEFKKILSRLNLNLEDKLESKVGLLSGGQRQALSLLMATIVEPQLLLLDEHTAALDPKTSELIINLTESLVEEKQLTTIMVTHNLKQAIEVGNRLIMFHKGKIILDIDGEEKKNLTVSELINYFNKLHISNDLSDALLLT